MPFRIALSGLNSASADLKVTGNNVANAGTTGFKASRTEFVDVFAVGYNGISSIAIGGGSRVAAVEQEFSQGNVDFTDKNLDLAINGLGFFVLSNEGERVLSRAGAFHTDRDGFVINSSRHKLQVFPATTLPSGVTTFDTGTLTDLQLSTNAGSPAATTTLTSLLNVDASETAPVPAFAATDPTSYNHSTSLTIYDSLGASHKATQYFRKTAPNNWDVYLTIDDNLVGGANPMTFDVNGNLTVPVTGSITFPATTHITAGPSGSGLGITGAAEITLTVDYGKTTQYGSPFGVSALKQDGFATGRLSGIDVNDEGVVSARFTNGQLQVLGKVAMANVPNPQDLSPLGDTVWGENFSAGDVLLGEAGTSSFGLIQSGALEASNVDIAEQLVNLIVAQRNFQANAQVITTADTVTQTIINIR